MFVLQNKIVYQTKQAWMSLSLIFDAMSVLKPMPLLSREQICSPISFSIGQDTGHIFCLPHALIKIFWQNFAFIEQTLWV